PAAARAGSAAGAGAGLARRRRAGRERRPDLADRRLVRARGMGPDGDPGRGPPEPPADPDGGRLGGPPAAQGLPDRRRAGPLLGGGVGVAIAPERRSGIGDRRNAVADAPIYPGTRSPSPVPTQLQPPPGLEDVLTVSFGPNHPSTHGVLRLIVDLHGEDVVGLEAVVGYLHTAFEKNMEQKTYWKGVTYAPRMDYLAFQANEYAFVAAVEKLLEIEAPPKATWMRTLLLELNRIHSHLIW